MTYIKPLILVSVLIVSSAALADSGDTYQNMEDSVYHERYHEPKHAKDQAKHDKGSMGFKKADKDDDGTLDREEAKMLPNVSKNFDAIDVDKDGTVDRDEVHNYMKNQKSK